MKFAYADPPYIGCAKRLYDCEEIDHEVLIHKLHDNYEGWALSTHMPGLWDLIPMIPKDWKCRVAAWCKPIAFGKPNVYPFYTWEPIIFKNGRNKTCKGRLTPRDFIECMPERKGFRGSKPDEFCYWLFELLGMTADDEFDDLFSGTGRVMRAWEAWKTTGMELFL